MWIEIEQLQSGFDFGVVTSLAEVWIEIMEELMYEECTLSLPLRKCGLKCCSFIMKQNTEMSLPLRKCGLKSLERTNGTPASGHFPCGSVD